VDGYNKIMKKDLFLGLFGSFVVSTAYLLYQGIGVKKALFGFFYFLVTPFLAIPNLPVSVVVIVILFLLFRRASSCMRVKYRPIAYLVLWLHLLAWGLYTSRFVVI
jgi:hypothetical protein